MTKSWTNDPDEKEEKRGRKKRGELAHDWRWVASQISHIRDILKADSILGDEPHDIPGMSSIGTVDNPYFRVRMVDPLGVSPPRLRHGRSWHKMANIMRSHYQQSLTVLEARLSNLGHVMPKTRIEGELTSMEYHQLSERTRAECGFTPDAMQDSELREFGVTIDRAYDEERGEIIGRLKWVNPNDKPPLTPSAGKPRRPTQIDRGYEDEDDWGDMNFRDVRYEDEDE